MIFYVLHSGDIRPLDILPLDIPSLERPLSLGGVRG